MVNWDYVLVPFGSELFIDKTDSMVIKDKNYKEYYFFGVRIARFRLDPLKEEK